MQVLAGRHGVGGGGAELTQDRADDKRQGEEREDSVGDVDQRRIRPIGGVPSPITGVATIVNPT